MLVFAAATDGKGIVSLLGGLGGVWCCWWTWLGEMTPLRTGLGTGTTAGGVIVLPIVICCCSAVLGCVDTGADVATGGALRLLPLVPSSSLLELSPSSSLILKAGFSLSFTPAVAASDEPPAEGERNSAGLLETTAAIPTTLTAPLLSRRLRLNAGMPPPADASGECMPSSGGEGLRRNSVGLGATMLPAFGAVAAGARGVAALTVGTFQASTPLRV